MRNPLFLLIPLAILMGILLVACEDGVHPFVGEERPFTVWGFMDAGSDTQKVRVFSIDERLGTDRPGPIDAKVVSTNLHTGEQKVWTDSVVTYFDGSVGHVFWSPFRARHEHRYRLEVVRSDGAASTAEVTLPSASSIELDIFSPMAFIPVLITGSVPNVIDLRVIYEVVPAYPVNAWPAGTATPPDVILPIGISYDDRKRATSAGWAFDIEMQSDVAVIEDELRRFCLPDSAILRRMEVRFLAADSAWYPPRGTFNPNDLIEPNVLSNIKNGYGFLGAGETVSLRWFPPREPQYAAGFVRFAPCVTDARPHCTIMWPCFRCEEKLPAKMRRTYCTGEFTSAFSCEVSRRPYRSFFQPS